MNDLVTKYLHNSKQGKYIMEIWEVRQFLALYVV